MFANRGARARTLAGPSNSEQKLIKDGEKSEDDSDDEEWARTVAAFLASDEGIASLHYLEWLRAEARDFVVLSWFRKRVAVLVPALLDKGVLGSADVRRIVRAVER